RHQLAPATEHRLECVVETPAFLSFTAEQRDALAVLAHAREGVAILRLSLVLVLGHGDEPTPDDRHGPAGEYGVDDRRDDQEAGDVERRPAEGHCQRPPDEPAPR